MFNVPQPLALGYNKHAVVCPDAGTPSALPWLTGNLVSWCMFPRGSCAPVVYKADVLWCRGALYGTAGWARRNTPGFAGGSRRARGFRALSPCPTSCPGCREGGQGEIEEHRSVPRPLSRSLTLIAFDAAGKVPLATFSQVTCAKVASVVPLSAPCDLVPWCLTFSKALVAHASLDSLLLEVAFSRIMLSDVGGSRMTQRAGLRVTFPCSSAGLWFPRVGLHFLVHLVSGLWEREARRNERSVYGSPPEIFIVFSALCFTCAYPAASCWCQVPAACF